MGVTAFEWGARVQHEANKCWFYALVVSIVLAGFELILLSQGPTKEDITEKSEKKDKKKAKPKASALEKVSKPARSKILMQLIIDCCDLLIPGAAVGWTSAPLAAPLVVGVASTISTTVAGTQIWKRVQQTAP